MLHEGDCLMEPTKTENLLIIEIHMDEWICLVQTHTIDMNVSDFFLGKLSEFYYYLGKS